MRDGLIKRMMIWPMAALETLFILCALSVVAYRVQEIAFDFAFWSYRSINIALSVLVASYLAYALLKSYRHALVLTLLFGVFHFVDGALTHLWVKAVIHGLILLLIGGYYYSRRTLALAV